MAFDIENSAGETSESKIDWDALNKYTVETANLQEPETVVGVVVGIVDLGVQDQEDAEVVFVGTPEDEERIVVEKPDTYFIDGIDQQTKKRARLKCWPVKPQPCVAVAVDFPDILLNKGQFFNDKSAELKPLRLWLGDTFYTKEHGSVIARLTALKPSNLEKDKSKPPIWSLAQNHLFYKMAVASKIVKPGESFDRTQIDEVLGHSYQFQVQVFTKEGKDGKEYLQEKIKFVGGLGRGQTAPESPVEPFLIQFNKVNSEESVKQLRAHVVNTIKKASNYNGSAIQRQLGDKVVAKAEVPVAEKPKPAATKIPAKVAAKVEPAPEPEDNDADVPF
jgi:hypothetical protein